MEMTTATVEIIQIDGVPYLRLDTLKANSFVEVRETQPKDRTEVLSKTECIFVGVLLCAIITVAGLKMLDYLNDNK